MGMGMVMGMDVGMAVGMAVGMSMDMPRCMGVGHVHGTDDSAILGYD